MARKPDGTWLSFAAVAFAGSMAFAAQAAEPVDAELSAWLAKATDLAASQVVLVTPEQVYSLEPLGPRLATDEVIALVRTEARDAGGAAASGARSWEAHVLFDCKGSRLRVIRSAGFPEHNRKGRPQSTPELGDWQSPASGQPAARLMAAACKPNYAWPLRASVKIVEAPKPVLLAEAAPPPAPSPSPVVSPPAEAAVPPAPPPEARPSPPPSPVQVAATPVALSPAPAAPPPPAAATPPLATTIKPEAAPTTPAPPAAKPQPQGFVVQVARGPSVDGARWALNRARKTLGRDASDLTTAIEPTRLGRRMRYTAVLAGFETAEAALRACKRLQEAAQTCFARPAGETDAELVAREG